MGQKQFQTHSTGNGADYSLALLSSRLNSSVVRVAASPNHLRAPTSHILYIFPIGIMNMMALPTPDKLEDPSEDKLHEHLVCLINTAKHNRKQPETSIAT